MGFAWNYALNLAAARMGFQPVRPLLFSFYLTHRCALKCRYCSDGEGRHFSDVPVDELTTHDAKRLVSVLARSCDTLDLTGGEPMVRPDLEEIMSHARHVGMRVVLNTKGHGLGDRPGLLALSDVLAISVDSLDVSRLAAIQGTTLAVAGRTLAALDFVLARRAQTGTKVILTTVASPSTIGDVAEVLRFAAAKGLGFQVSPEIAGTKVKASLRGNPDYVALMTEVEVVKEKGTVLGIPEYLRGIREFMAYECYPLLMPTIRPDGHLYYPCLETGRAPFSILGEGGYERALRKSRTVAGPVPTCGENCAIFCHMGLSLLQRHPVSALREGACWRRIGGHQAGGAAVGGPRAGDFVTQGGMR
jgi:MoaA/NifB/PqqE/SkfB family radical SAM enzyme